MNLTILGRANKFLFLFVCALFKIIVLIVCTPFFILFICPIYLIRGLVLLASKVLRPDLVTILGIRDTFYAIDEITTSPKSTVLQTIVLRGDFSKEMVMKTWTRLLSETRNGGKELKYPEFKRYLVKWMGFIFWKQDSAFSLENHIKYYNTRKSSSGFIGPSELKLIEKIIINEPYLPHHSPWEFQVVRNYQLQDEAQEINGNYVSDANENHTAVLFKVHHSFVDGLLLLNMFIKDIIQAPDTSYISKANFPKRSILQNAVLGIWLLFKAPYDTLSDILMEPDKNPWYLRKDRITNEINSALSPPISSQQIKDISEGFNVSFTSTIIAAITGGIRMMMIEQGRNPNRANFSCLAPFPVPGRPETMGNYLSDCYVEFPIKISDPIQRIKQVEAQLHSLKYSTVPLSSFAVQPFFGGLFYWMLAPMVQFALSKSTGIVSVFPGPRKEIFWDGHAVVDAYFSAGHDTPGIGIQFLGFSYNGVWRLKIQADKGTLSTDSEVEKLIGYVVQELDSYYKSTFVSLFLARSFGLI